MNSYDVLSYICQALLRGGAERAVRQRGGVRERVLQHPRGDCEPDVGERHGHRVLGHADGEGEDEGGAWRILLATSSNAL